MLAMYQISKIEDLDPVKSLSGTTIYQYHTNDSHDVPTFMRKCLLKVLHK